MYKELILTTPFRNIFCNMLTAIVKCYMCIYVCGDVCVLSFNESHKFCIYHSARGQRTDELNKECVHSQMVLSGNLQEKVAITDFQRILLLHYF